MIVKSVIVLGANPSKSGKSFNVGVEGGLLNISAKYLDLASTGEAESFVTDEGELYQPDPKLPGITIYRVKDVNWSLGRQARKLAEVTSRFDSVEKFKDAVTMCNELATMKF